MLILIITLTTASLDSGNWVASWCRGDIISDYLNPANLEFDDLNLDNLIS